MRYVVAIMVSLALVSVICILMVLVARLEKHRWRQGFIAAKERGDIPPDADIESAAIGIEVPGIEVIAFGLLKLWKNFRVLFVPLIIAVSLTIAWYTSNPVPSPQHKTSN